MEGRAARDAGVVDQHLDRTHLGFDAGHGSGRRSDVDDVEGTALGLQPFAAQLLHRGVELGRVAAVQHHAGAGLREAARQRQADAARGAGDERDAAVEAEGVCGDHGPVASSARRAASARASGGALMSSVTGRSSGPGGSSVCSWLSSSDAGM